MAKLTNEKHERFVQEYLIDLNATQAYIRAEYSPKGAGTAAARLLKNVRVRARVDELLAERSKRTGITQDRVLREFARVGFLDPTKLIDLETARIRPGATEDDRACIASVKVKTGEDFTERKIRFADKLKALELAGKHLGMFTERIAVMEENQVIVLGKSEDAEYG